MWDNGAPPDAPLTRAAPATGHQAETCATCERPAPSGKLRCDACIEQEWLGLEITMGMEWVHRHAAYRRPRPNSEVEHGQP